MIRQQYSHSHRKRLLKGIGGDFPGPFPPGSAQVLGQGRPLAGRPRHGRVPPVRRENPRVLGKARPLPWELEPWSISNIGLRDLENWGKEEEGEEAREQGNKKQQRGKKYYLHVTFYASL